MSAKDKKLTAPARKSSQQSRRFIEAARELGADGTEEDLDRALKKMAIAKPPAEKPKTKLSRKSRGAISH